MRRLANNEKVPVIKKWLRRRMLQESLINLGLAILSFSFGLGVFAFTLGGVCILAFIAYPDKKDLVNWLYNGTASRSVSMMVIGALAAMVVILMFVGNAINQRGADEMPYGPARRGRKYRSNSVFSMGKSFADALYIGPSLLIAAMGFLRQSVRQDRLEVENCAKILSILLTRNSRFSFAELTRQSNISNTMRVVPQLMEIEGVVFLKSDPPGLSLTAELREELFALYEEESIETKAEKTEEPPAEVDPDSPYVLLGIAENAGLSEIKTAYRRRIKERHPDKFAALGLEWRVLAEERSKQLNAAYEALMAGFTADMKRR
ncbi:MAG: hypothetical protein JWQ71_3423 [Pedosphaera sp.]|nr:hypothetical protein [Pedosphaera sp.]